MGKVGLSCSEADCKKQYKLGKFHLSDAMAINYSRECATSVAAELLRRNYMSNYVSGSVLIVPVSKINSIFRN
jgi:hypothetical protein